MRPVVVWLEKDEPSYSQQKAAQWPFYQGLALIARRRQIAVSARQRQPDGQTSRSNGRFINARPNGRFIKAEATGWPDLHILATTCNFAIIPHNQFISGRAKLFSAKAAQWPFYQRQAQWPFYQWVILSTPGPMAVLSRQRQRMARLADFSRKLQFRYYPAQSIYQRPGQAIFSKSRPNGRFINARPNGRFIKVEATGWPDL